MDKLEPKQVGGTHYQGYDYQPIDLIEDLNLSFAEGCILKYIIRFRDKGGKEDLLKALDYVARELIKYLKTPEEERVKKEIDRKAIGLIVTFTAQDRIEEEDRDFILDVAKYLHAGMMTKVGQVIMDKIKKIYFDKEGKLKPYTTSSPNEQLKNIKEAVDHVLNEVKELENVPKDHFLQQATAEHESYLNMKLMLQIISDTITL